MIVRAILLGLALLAMPAGPVWGQIPGLEDLELPAMEDASFERLMVTRSGSWEQTSGMSYRINHGQIDGPYEVVQPVLRISVTLRPAWDEIVPGVGQSLRQVQNSLRPGERLADVQGLATIPIEANIRIEHDDMFISQMNNNGRAWVSGTRNRRFESLSFILNCNALGRVRDVQIFRDSGRQSLDLRDPVRLTFGPVLIQNSGQQDRFSPPGANITQRSGLLLLTFDNLRTFHFDYEGPYWSQGAIQVAIS